MDAVFALMLLAAVGDPALAGAPHSHAGKAEHRIEYRIEHRLQPHETATRRGLQDRSHGGHHRRHHDSHGDARRAREAVRAGDPIALQPAFFATSLAGGVERPARIRVYGRGGVILIAPAAAPAPVSAGQAAAARGLPRG